MQPKEVEAIPESDDPPIEPVPPASESKAELVEAAPAADTMSEAGDVEETDSDAEQDQPVKRFLIPTSDPINEMDCLGNPQREMLYAGWESGFADERCSVVSRSFRKGFLTASSPFQRLSEKQLYAVFDFARDGLAFLMCEAACRGFCRLLRGSDGLGRKLWAARPIRYGGRVLGSIPGVCAGTTTYVQVGSIPGTLVQKTFPACTYPHDLEIDDCGRQGVLAFAALSVMRDEMYRSGNAGLVIFRHIAAERWATIVADVYARSRCLGVHSKLVRLDDLTDIIKDATEIVEVWAIELIRNAVRCSLHRKSMTLTAADLELARTITQDRTCGTAPYYQPCDVGVDVHRARLSGQPEEKRFSIDALPSIRVAVKDRIIRSLVRRAGGVAFNVRAYEMLWVLILQRMCRLLERVAVLAAYREGVDSDPTLSLRPEIRDLMYANEGLEGRFYSPAEHMDTDDDDDDDDDDSSIGSLSDLSTDDGEYDPDERDIAAEAQARLERSLARRKCDACGKQGEISERPFPTCDLCGHRRYCGRRCQRADWLTHKVDCPGYAHQQQMSDS